jgi:holliday junction DNA helicase RuvB
MNNGGFEKLSEFVGNETVKQQVAIVLNSVQKQNSIYPHTLLYGNPGSGKTTLARIIANELGNPIITITGNTIKNQIELCNLLTDMFYKYKETGKSVILFIDEVHAIAVSKELDQTIWFPLLEDFIFYSNLKGKRWEYNGQMVEGTTNEAKFPPFTCIGATTNITDLDPALRRRFHLQLFMQPYSEQELSLIVKQHAGKRNISITEEACFNIAKRGRYTPATVLSYFQNCYHYMVANDKTIIDNEVVNSEMEVMGIDAEGLKWEDRQVLKTLAQFEKGLGENDLANISGIPRDVLIEIVEPFLKEMRFMYVTNRRVITKKGMEYINGVGK